VTVSANQREPDMDATTVAVDLAKNVFQLAVADARGKIIARHRLSRSQFERWFHNRAVDRAPYGTSVPKKLTRQAFPMPA
jgi:hypothetical protein